MLMSVIKLKRVEKAIRRICNYFCCSLSSCCLFRCMPHTEMLPRDANGPFQLAKCFLSSLLFEYSVLIELLFFIVSLEKRMKYSVVAFICYRKSSNWIVYFIGSSKSIVALFCSILFHSHEITAWKYEKNSTQHIHISFLSKDGSKANISLRTVIARTSGHKSTIEKVKPMNDLCGGNRKKKSGRYVNVGVFKPPPPKDTRKVALHFAVARNGNLGTVFNQFSNYSLLEEEPVAPFHQRQPFRWRWVGRSASLFFFRQDFR